MSKLILPIERPFDYRINVPGSKSIALRQLLISALAKDESLLTDLPPCDDVDAMVNCLQRLGTEFAGSFEQGLRVFPKVNLTDDIELDAAQSGVSLRLLLGVVALRSGTTAFTGHRSLAQRPNLPLLDSLEQLGCEVESEDGKLPITVRGPAVSPHTTLDATLSSQFLSALLLVAPALEDGLRINLLNELASASYADGTLRELSRRGITVKHDKLQSSFEVEPQRYQGSAISIEGDASAATYHMALATLHQSTVHLSNVGTESWQPDYEFLKVCKRLGAKVTACIANTTISGPPELEPLRQVDMSSMPDAAPTLMAIAPYLPEPIHITGLDTLRHKECDRISCPANELKKAGIQVEEKADSLKIWPGEVKPTSFDTYDDHRMAMSFAVLASRAQGCRINDPKCVNKTYVNFWRDLANAYR